MGKNRRHTAAVACVLLLNLQLFAANALGCIHQAQADGSASTLTSCPHVVSFMTQPASGDAEPGAPAAAVSPDLQPAEACQKCNLGKVASGWHLVTAQAPQVARSGALLPQARLVARLTTPTPDGLLRPPRSFSG